MFGLYLICYFNRPFFRYTIRIIAKIIILIQIPCLIFNILTKIDVGFLHLIYAPYNYQLWFFHQIHELSCQLLSMRN